jgi:hypothetical protein
MEAISSSPSPEARMMWQCHSQPTAVPTRKKSLSLYAIKMLVPLLSQNNPDYADHHTTFFLARIYFNIAR